MAVQDVGARLVLDPGAFSATADMAIAKMREITAAAEEMGAAVDASSASIAGAADAAAGVSGKTAGTAVAEDAALGADAVVAGESKKQKALKDTTDVVEDEVKKQKSILSQLADNGAVTKLATWGVGGLLAGTYETVKQYSKFNALVTQSAVDAGVPKGDLTQVSKALIADSKQYGLNVDDLANSWYRVASAMSGGHATLKQMLSLTKDAAKLDVLFNVPAGNQTEQLARIMGSMMHANLTGAKTPDQIMALANVSVGSGDIRGADMISALGKMLSADKSMNAPAPDMMAWIDTLTKNGMQGSQAGTLIAHSVQQLVNPSEQGQKAEQMVGIVPGTLGNLLATKGVGAAVDYLTNSMKKFNPTSFYPTFGSNAPGSASAAAQLTAWGIADPATIAAFQAGTMDPAQQKQIQSALLNKIFGGAKGAQPMLAITSDEAAFNELVSHIKNGATQKALEHSFDIAMNTPERQQKIAEANIKTATLGIGKMLTPAYTSALRDLGDFATMLANNSAALKTVVGSIVGLIGVAASIKAVNFFSKLGTDLKSLGSSIFGRGGGAGGAAEDTAAETMQTAADTMLEAATRMAGGSIIDRGGAGYGTVYSGAESTAAEDAVAGGIFSKFGSVLSKTLGGALAGVIAAAITHEVASKLLPKSTQKTDPYAVDQFSGLVGGAAAGRRIAGTPGAVIGGALGLTAGSALALHTQWTQSDQLYKNMSNPLWALQHKQLFDATYKQLMFNHTMDGVAMPSQIPKWAGDFYARSTKAVKGPYTGIPGFSDLNTPAGRAALTAAGYGKDLPPESGSSKTADAAAKSMSEAATKHLTAAADMQKAADLWGPTTSKENTATSKSQTASDKMTSAAEKASQSAEKLSSAADQLTGAANKLSNVKITAQVSPTQVSAASTSQQANQLARG